MIKTMLLYRVNHADHIALLNDPAALSDALAEKPERHPEKSQWYATGFAPLAPDLSDDLVWSAPANVNVLRYMIHERALTAATIREHVVERAKVIVEREQRKPYRSEFAQLKDLVIAELLPKAFIKHREILVFVIKDLLVIGASTARNAEMVLEDLRSVMGSLLVTPFTTKTPPRDWLASLMRNETIGHLKVLDQVKLTNEDKDVVTYKGIDLSADEPQSFLDSGFHPKEMAIMLADEMSFRATDTLIIKGIKFAVELSKTAKDEADGDLAAERDGNIMLITNAVNSLVRTIEANIGEDRPEIKTEDGRLRISAINGVPFSGHLEDLLDPEAKLASLRDQFQSAGQPDEVEFEDF